MKSVRQLLQKPPIIRPSPVYRRLAFAAAVHQFIDWTCLGSIFFPILLPALFGSDRAWQPQGKSRKETHLQKKPCVGFVAERSQSRRFPGSGAANTPTPARTQTCTYTCRLAGNIRANDPLAKAQHVSPTHCGWLSQHTYLKKTPLQPQAAPPCPEAKSSKQMCPAATLG